MASGSDDSNKGKRERETASSDFDISKKLKGANGESSSPSSSSRHHTSSNSTLEMTRSEQSPLSIHSKYGGSAAQRFGKATANEAGEPYGQHRSGQIFEVGTGVNVSLELGDGKYVVEIKKRRISSSTDENEMERAKQMAQSAGMLFLQAEMLRDMGEQLLAQYQASLRSIFRSAAP